MAFEIKQNDRRPFFVVSLVDNAGEADEEPVDLTTAGTVVFNMRPSSGGAVKVSRGTCSVTDAVNGEVTYQWGTLDTNTAGSFHAEVEVLWSDAKAETFPSGPSADSYFDVTITDDIA